MVGFKISSSRNPVIVCDVDMTVTNPCNGNPRFDWYTYLRERCTDMDESRYEEDVVSSCVDYDLTQYFTLPCSIDGFDFWRQENLYQNILPYVEAQEVLGQLSEDFDIIFMSFCKANHYKSKYLFLKEYFPYMKAFYASKCKTYHCGDIFIDDRNMHLNEQRDGVYSIKMDTSFTQCQGLVKSVDRAENWCSIRDKVLAWKEGTYGP